MASTYQLQPGWKVWVTLMSSDDGAHVWLNSELVCLAFSKIAPTKQVEITNLLAPGPNSVVVSIHNVWPSEWFLRHLIRVRDAAMNPVPSIPDGAIDISHGGKSAGHGEHARWEYV